MCPSRPISGVVVSRVEYSYFRVLVSCDLANFTFLLLFYVIVWFSSYVCGCTNLKFYILSLTCWLKFAKG